MKSTLIDLTGLRFGRLVVVSRAENIRPKVARWLCICDCGGHATANGLCLKFGYTKSCGCLINDVLKDRNTKHGRSKSDTHRIWCGIKTRCNNPNADSYKGYGGRGIKICDKWADSFEAFLVDMGERPSKQHSIERIDVNGNYEPSNCKWILNKDQTSNMRSNVFVTHDGKTLTMAQWERETGIKAYVITDRIRNLGWDVARALTQKPRDVHHPSNLHAPP
jgi:hypothetical protein